VTAYAVPVSDTWTLPDDTSEKLYYIGTATSSGWKRGLIALVNTYDNASTLKRQAMTSWTQDNESLSYPLNPRVLETNIYDPAGNHKRTGITYQSASFGDGTSCHLPQDVIEYQADATTVLRRSHTDYNLSPTYTSSRIIGLPGERTLYEVDPNTQTETLMSKVGFQYDESGSIQGTDAPVQHDNTNYSASFVSGRANLSSLKRYDATNTSQFTTTSSKYNTAGAVVFTSDPLNHTVSVSYADSFSDGNNSRNTLAYPTTVTDPDGYSSTAKYNFDFGAVTYEQTPMPNVTTNTPGPEQTLTYDTIGRLERTTSLVNSAYTRYIYGPNYLESWSTVNLVADEAHGLQVFDGAGRVIAKATNHLGSIGGWSAQKVLYDNMGRESQTSNPTETSIPTPTSTSINPSQWNATGDDAMANGGFDWVYTAQMYDWKGRPKLITNTDQTTQTLVYSGCGCAGGEMVTTTDETGRKRKSYSDVLGRNTKIEIYQTDGITLYSTTSNTYNGLDQLTDMKVYDETNQSRPFQETTIDYDGFGRLRTRHVPEQQVDAGNSVSTDQTTWQYNADDTVQMVVDARGVSATYTYNARRLLKRTQYAGPSGVGSPLPSGVTASATVDIDYDGAGNRITMSDGIGSVIYQYNQRSQLTWESRSFSQLNPSQWFTVTHDYNLAGQIKSLTDPFSSTVSYALDATGQLTDVTGSGVQYATEMTYRAWGGLKHRKYGNNLNLDLAYNKRLQNTQYDLINAGSGARVMGMQYRYTTTDTSTDNDGRLKYSHDLVTANLDRINTFDILGRQDSGHAGVLINDGHSTFHSGPFDQSYSYDVWGNLIGQQWRTYETISFPGGSFYGAVTHGYQDTFVNNRNTASGWHYDASGMLLTSITDGITRNYAYDAAGEMISASEPNKTAQQAFDGDGLRLRYVENGVATYYVISSVLGGRVITELDQSGQKKRGYVYQGGETLAKQEGAQQLWDQRDPSGASARLTDANGNVTSKVEVDPLGTQVSDSASYNYSGATGYVSSPAGFYGSGTQPHDCAVPGLGVSIPCGLTGRRSLGWGIGVYRNENHIQTSGRAIDPSDNTVIDIWGHEEVVTTTVRFPILLAGSANSLTSSTPQGPVPQEPAPQPQPQPCGVNPITGTAGFTRDPRGVPGNLRPGVGGQGYFGAHRIHDRRGHQGLDISGISGQSAVYANGAGRIQTIGAAGLAGNRITIDQGNGVVTLYGHLDSFTAGLQVGSQVASGQQIGIVGQTGNAAGQPLTEAHVHFGVSFNGANQDPELFLNGGIRCIPPP
jgi:YD repeat-containing protein